MRTRKSFKIKPLSELHLEALFSVLKKLGYDTCHERVIKSSHKRGYAKLIGVESDDRVVRRSITNKGFRSAPEITIDDLYADLNFEPSYKTMELNSVTVKVHTTHVEYENGQGYKKIHREPLVKLVKALHKIKEIGTRVGSIYIDKNDDYCFSLSSLETMLTTMEQLTENQNS